MIGHTIAIGRTTGIEPAHGEFTIHCLDPLGYIRPYTMKKLHKFPFLFLIIIF
uniref:Ribosomal protein S19 n=1 Tax=Cercis chuniana TaxID=161752 RepID=A0A3Q8G8F6_9FABA|nr:ribosomal protein S19 [Cercis chuniana]